MKSDGGNGGGGRLILCVDKQGDTFGSGFGVMVPVAERGCVSEGGEGAKMFGVQIMGERDGDIAVYFVDVRYGFGGDFKDYVGECLLLCGEKCVWEKAECQCEQGDEGFGHEVLL